MSLAKAGEVRTIEDPLLAIYSLAVNLTPFTNTSRKPTLYENENVVCPFVAVVMPVVRNVGKSAQVTPTPVDFKYCPFVPVVVPALTAP